jgi:hypothetical protein
VGSCDRSHNGSIVCSAWGVIPHCQSASVAAAIACKNGLHVDINNYISDLVIETDCMAVIEGFKEGSMDRSEVSIIANEFKLKIPLTVK